MPKYVFYMRAEEGNIERLGDIIVDRPDGALLGSYEQIDFPETAVFWANELGSSVGIAPQNPLPIKTHQEVGYITKQLKIRVGQQ